LKYKGYRKTEAFTKFLKGMGSAKSGYSSNLDDSFESGGDFGEEARKANKKQAMAEVVHLFPPQEYPEPVFEDDEQPPLLTEEPRSEQISFFEEEEGTFFLRDSLDDMPPSPKPKRC